MLAVHVSSRFRRSYRKQPRHIQEDFDQKIILMQSEPFHPALGTHKLSGDLADYYSFYLRDGFRVLFDFVEPNVILLVNVGSHDDYRKWGRI